MKKVILVVALVMASVTFVNASEGVIQKVKSDNSDTFTVTGLTFDESCTVEEGLYFSCLTEAYGWADHVANEDSIELWTVAFRAYFSVCDEAGYTYF